MNLKYYLLVTLLLSSLSGNIVAAKPYQPLNTLRIQTELNTIGGSGTHPSAHRLYEVHASSGSLIFTTPSQKSTALAQLNFKDSTIHSWQKDMQSQAQEVNGDLFLRPGFPLPVNILPLAQKDKVTSYKVTTHAGGRAFIKTYSVSVEKLPQIDAQQKGWLKKIVDADVEFWLYVVTDKDNRVVAKQLWPENGDWWLYEETQFRRSWLLE